MKKVESNSYEIVRCKKCGYGFVNPRPSQKFLIEFYSEVGIGSKTDNEVTLDKVLIDEKDFPNSILDAERIINSVNNFLYKQKGSDKRFLDVGCGYGFFSKTALQNGFEVTAIEMASLERNIAAELTGLKIYSNSFEEFNHNNSSFEVILMSQILEHVLDVNQWMIKASSLLSSNGILVIALPNFGSLFRLILQENEPYIIPPSHLNYFSYKSLRLLLQKHGFEIIKVDYITRLPLSSVTKRLAHFGKYVPKIVNTMIPALLWSIDKIKMGSMLNIYARKL
jgi:2-polyprenyl-3-methyl-5-hydroxy-6-metoxy-1,4-benzoquinol methylase